MASIKLITCLALILIIPASGILANASAGHSESPATDYYSFSGQTGAFPDNASWIGFSTFGNGTGYNISIQDGQYGKGIGITTQDNLTMTYLKMALNTSLYTMVQIGFSWSDNLSVGYTYISFPVYYGKSEIGDIAINRTQNATVVSSLGLKYRLSQEPELGVYYDIKLFFSTSYADNFYLEIFRNGTDQMVLPLDIKTEMPFSNNLSIMAGGRISEFNIYNITDFSGSAGIFQTPLNGAQLHSSSSPIPYSLRPYGSGDQAVLFPSLNSAFYVGWNNELIKYNYENRSFSKIVLAGVNTTMKPLGIYSQMNVIYFLMSDASASILFFLNVTSGMQGNITLSDLQDAKGLLILNEHLIAAYNSSGMIVFINTSNGNSQSSVSAWNTGTEYYLAGIYAKGSSVIVEGVNLSTGSIITERIAPGSLIKTVLASSTFSRFDGKMGIYQTEIYNDGITSLLSNNLTGDNHFTLINGLGVELAQSNQTIAYSGQTPVVFNGSAYILIGNYSSTALQLPEIASSTLWFNGNYSAGSEVNSTEIVIFFHNQSEVYSGRNITIRLSGHYLLRGEAYVNTTVASTIGFIVNITIDGFHFVSSQEDLIIDSEEIPDGNYTMYAYATNSDGYNSSAISNCTVDNNNPTVVSTPVNGSSVYFGQDISIDVSNISGFLKSQISSPVFTESTYSAESSINVTAESGSQEFPVYVNVTDIYGEVFSRYLAFTILNTSYSNFSINLFNGEFFSHGNLTLSWTSIKNISSYDLRVLGKNSLSNVTVNGSDYRLQLGSGNFTLYLYPMLGDGAPLTEFEYNFTIIAFAPGITVSVSNESMYSFFGNSLNNSLSIIIKSNISSEITANFTSPSGVVFDAMKEWNILQVSVDQDSVGFEENGIYRFSYCGRSESGTESNGSLVIAVNNTVPVIRDTRGENLFTNVSSVHANLGETGNASLFYSFSIGSYSVNFTAIENGTINLTKSQGLYHVSLMELTRSGNFAFYNFSVLYSQAKPVISIRASETQIRFMNYTVISYTIKDLAPIKSMKIAYGNHSYSVDNPVQNGGLLIFFSSNGVYNFSVTAEDKCLNSNSSASIALNVTYYVTVNETTIASSIFGTSGKFSLDMTGTNLQNVNLSWYLNGKYVGTGSSVSTNLPLGSSNISCLIEYDGKTFVISKQNYVVGFDPFYAAFLAIGAISVSRYLLSRRKDSVARELIMGNSGKSVREITALGRKAKVMRRSIRRQIRSLSGNGDITMERDLSNEIYVFVNGEGK